MMLLDGLPLLLAEMATPLPWLAEIVLPATRLPDVPVPAMWTPSLVLSAIVLRAADTAPPIVFRRALEDIDSIDGVAQVGVAGGVGANIVRHHRVADRPGILDIDPAGAVLSIVLP